jgi:phosphatidylserine decarboxylase
MESIKQWLSRPDVGKVGREPTKKLLFDSINRDPNRSITYTPLSFLSPADGVILYSKFVQPEEPIIEVKGDEYTTEELLKEEVKFPCLVVGIFMTCLDVHINRMPTDGFNHYQPLDALKVMNLSMRSVENAILKEMSINPNSLNYALYNERVKNRIFYPKIDQYYWIIQIADFEVDVIAHFAKPNEYYTQGERFAVVRMGSQVDLIIPLIGNQIIFTPLITEGGVWHVEAGIDQIVKIEMKERRWR